MGGLSNDLPSPVPEHQETLPAIRDNSSVVELAAVDPCPITDEEAEVAIRESKIKSITVDQIKAYAKIGKYLRKAGMVEFNSGRLAYASGALDKARTILLEAMTDASNLKEDESLTDEAALNLVRMANGVGALCKVEQGSIKLDMQLDKLGRTTAAPTKNANQAPPPGVIVNVHSEKTVLSAEPLPNKRLDAGPQDRSLPLE